MQDFKHLSFVYIEIYSKLSRLVHSKFFAVYFQFSNCESCA